MIVGRDLRYLPSPGALVEVTVRTLQQRYLLRPGPRLNPLVVGVLAKGQVATGMRVHAVAVMSNHLHLLASPTSTRQLADFMSQVNGNLSKEVGRLHDWPGTMFPRRYTSIPVSDEPQAQVARLRYLLEQGCKENLVAAPTDWPGVHSSRAMIEGRSMSGIWIDRTALFRARQRGETVSEAELTEHVELKLDPLPCWRHLAPAAYRARLTEIIETIERETVERHQRDRTAPKGAAWVRRRHPHERPKPGRRSPRPRFHAFARTVRERLAAAYREFLAAYRLAVQRLANGDTAVTFPDTCYPPRLPFVEPTRLEPG